MDITDLLSKVRTGSLPPVFNTLDSKLEYEDKETLETIVSKFPELMDTEDKFLLVMKVLVELKKLENYYKWIDHQCYINEFKDKSGNTYLQAKTSLKDEHGKTNWLGVYIGSLNDYPGGINDPAAIMKAKPLLRKKLKKYFGIK